MKIIKWWDSKEVHMIEYGDWEITDKYISYGLTLSYGLNEFICLCGFVEGFPSVSSMLCGVISQHE